MPRRYASLLSLFLLALCAASPAEHTILLIGDAGARGKDTGRENLKTLAAHAERAPKQTSIFFLGDNVYNSGVPPKSSPGFDSARARLHAQIDAVKQTGARIVFVPGNHDWNNARAGGQEAIRRQQEMVQAALGDESFLPRNACPGPEKVELAGGNISVIILDSQWWLHPEDKPNVSTGGCQNLTKESVVAGLQTLLQDSQGEQTLFLQHHPLRSYGMHATPLGVREHFSLFKKLPAPFSLASSIFLEAKRFRCTQHTRCRPYTEMSTQLATVLRENPPLVCAAGHDHSLQLIAGDDVCKNYIVSGAGAKPRSLRKNDELLSGYTGVGFVKLDFLASGDVRYQAIIPKPGHQLGEVYYEAILSRQRTL